MKKRQCYKICELIGSDTSKIIGDNTVGESSYISTGFVNLDELLLLNGGDVISIGGRPGMGKTALALNIAENIAIHNKLPVIIFSLHVIAIGLALFRMRTYVKGAETVENNEISKYEENHAKTTEPHP